MTDRDKSIVEARIRTLERRKAQVYKDLEKLEADDLFWISEYAQVLDDLDGRILELRGRLEPKEEES